MKNVNNKNKLVWYAFVIFLTNIVLYYNCVYFITKYEQLAIK